MVPPFPSLLPSLPPSLPRFRSPTLAIPLTSSSGPTRREVPGRREGTGEEREGKREG